jgi:hypothetical protein
MVTQSNSTTHWGDIFTKKGKRGLEFHAYNRERGRSVHVGTLSGGVFEKGRVSILRKPEPSIALKPDEYQSAKDAGATVFRAQTVDGETYVIRLDDFHRLKVEYFNPTYGKQLRVPLCHFQRSGTTVKRNAVLDNPRGGGRGEYVRPQLQQLPMFQLRQDGAGQYWG